MIVVQHLKTMNEFTAKMLEYNDIEYFAAPMTYTSKHTPASFFSYSNLMYVHPETEFPSTG